MHHQLNMAIETLSDDPFSLNPWPDVGSATAPVSKKHHKWIEAVIKKIAALEARCGNLEKENKTLADKVVALENNNKGTASWASLFSKDGKKSEEATALHAMVAKESRKIAHMEHNIVVSGLPVPATNESEDGLTNDEKENQQKERERELAKELLEEIGIRLEPVDVKRLKPRAITKPADSTSSAASTTPSPRSRPLPLIMSFRTPYERDMILKRAKDLKGSDRFKSVYLDVDKTQAERAEEFKLRQQRDTNNNKLPNERVTTNGRQRYGTDNGKHFFYAVRSGAVKRVYFDL